MPSPSVVQAIVNGQSFSVKASDIKFSLGDDTESATDWVHALIGPKTLRFHAGLVFLLKHGASEEDSGMTMTFELGTHCLTYIHLVYVAPEVRQQIDSFSVALLSYQPDRTATIPTSDLANSRGMQLLYEDYERMRVGRDADASFRLTTINQYFKICPTYPTVFAVPASISDATLRHAAHYRSRSRLPMLSYVLPTGAALFRSAQALVGIQRARSIQDERLIEAIRLASPRRSLLVLDARPARSAMANALNGGGFMLIEHYAGCDRAYLGIDNIHAVRDSYLRIFRNAFKRGLSERNSMQAAGWIRHYEAIMAGVKLIVESLREGMAILVHCSDGWDRTAQLVSLAQIVIDPHYRTIKGLMALVQREWVAAGHQFDLRLARRAPMNALFGGGLGGTLSKMLDRLTPGGSGRGEDTLTGPQEEFCPIFPQFLDCLLQLIRVNSRAFEYTATLVKDMWREVYVGETDTFAGNCERDRPTDRWRCYWRYLEERLRDGSSVLRNLTYKREEEPLVINQDVLFYV